MACGTSRGLSAHCPVEACATSSATSTPTSPSRTCTQTSLRCVCGVMKALGGSTSSITARTPPVSAPRTVTRTWKGPGSGSQARGSMTTVMPRSVAVGGHGRGA
jgi:hypothetical protein